jgi:hypothetical protein
VPLTNAKTGKVFHVNEKAGREPGFVFATPLPADLTSRPIPNCSRGGMMIMGMNLRWCEE